MPLKLRPSEVRNIRKQYARGATIRKLAAAYKVTDACVGQIVRGETWQHLQDVDTPLVPARDTKLKQRARMRAVDLDTLAEALNGFYTGQSGGSVCRVADAGRVARG